MLQNSENFLLLFCELFFRFYNNLCLGYNFGEFYKYSMTCYMKDKSICIILLIFPKYFKECKTSYNTKIRPVTYFFFFYSDFLVYLLVVI